MRTVRQIIVMSSVVLLLTGCSSEMDWEKLTNVLQNVQHQLPQIKKLVVAVSYTIGFWFVILGMMKLKKFGQGTLYYTSGASLSGSIAYLGIGAALMFLPMTMENFVQTIWGYGFTSDSYLNYPELDAEWQDALHPLFDVIKIVGLISFVRGWIIISKLANQGGQPGTMSKGLVHMIGGILAVNIAGTIDVLKATLIP